MRTVRAPGWAKPAAVVAAVVSAITAFAPTASAEEKFKRLFVFGDSYTDSDLAAFWRVYPLSLQEQLSIKDALNFGVGGARASPVGPAAVVPPGWHLQQQVDA